MATHFYCLILSPSPPPHQAHASLSLPLPPSLSQAADLLYQAGEVQVANTAILPWTGVAAVQPFSDPTILFFSADMDRTLDLSTCAPGTTTAASIAVYAVDDLGLVG